MSSNNSSIQNFIKKRKQEGKKKEHIIRPPAVRRQWTTEFSGSARMFPKSRVESVSSSISPITALKHTGNVDTSANTWSNWTFKSLNVSFYNFWATV